MNGKSNNPYPKKVFVFGNNTKLGEEVAIALEDTLSSYDIKIFKDGERLPHQIETVRSCDVFIVFTSQNGSETGKWLMDYLRFVRAIKMGHPHRITVILPKLPHQRQDVANHKLREPKMSDFYPDLLKAAGADYIIVCKLHNPASCTSVPPMDNVDTTFLIVNYIRENFPDLSKVAIASGDMGGAKYARSIADKFDTPLIITDKERDSVSGKTKVMKVYTYGEISQQIDTVIFVDDIISTFGTLGKGAEALSKQHPGITEFYAAATHADFCEETLHNVIDSKFKEVWVTDTVPVHNSFISGLNNYGKKIVFISVAKLIAKVIDNVHDGQPISALWE